MLEFKSVSLKDATIEINDKNRAKSLYFACCNIYVLDWAKKRAIKLNLNLLVLKKASKSASLWGSSLVLLIWQWQYEHMLQAQVEIKTLKNFLFNMQPKEQSN